MGTRFSSPLALASAVLPGWAMANLGIERRSSVRSTQLQRMASRCVVENLDCIAPTTAFTWSSPRRTALSTNPSACSSPSRLRPKMAIKRAVFPLLFFPTRVLIRRKSCIQTSLTPPKSWSLMSRNITVHCRMDASDRCEWSSFAVPHLGALGHPTNLCCPSSNREQCGALIDVPRCLSPQERRGELSSGPCLLTPQRVNTGGGPAVYLP